METQSFSPPCDQDKVTWGLCLGHSSLCEKSLHEPVQAARRERGVGGEIRSWGGKSVCNVLYGVVAHGLPGRGNIIRRSGNNSSFKSCKQETGHEFSDLPRALVVRSPGWCG